MTSEKQKHELQAPALLLGRRQGGRRDARGGEQLHTTPQTLSGQIKLLEERLGCKLFRKSGRGWS